MGAGRRELVLPVAVSVLALVLGLLFLDQKSLWLDEGYSVSFARLDLGRLFELASEQQANMSLYYFALHFWLPLGDSEVAIRLLSVFFAVSTVPVVYALGRRLFDTATAVIAALLISVNAFVIQYAQEARGYTLVLFLVALSSYLFVRAVEDERRSWWIAYGVVTALSAYAHFFAAFVVLAQLLMLAALRGGTRWRRAVGGVTLAALLSAPLLAFAVFRSGGQINWIPEPSPGDLGTALADLSGGGIVLGVLFLALGAYGLGVTGEHRDGAAGRWKWFLAAWVLLPPLVSFAASYAKPMFLSKYLIVAVPPLVLLAAKGLRELRPPFVQAGVALVIGVLGITGLVQWYGKDSREPWREAVAHVVSNAGPDDGVILYSARIWSPVSYYVGRLRRAEQHIPQLLYPRGGWGTEVPTNNEPPRVGLLSRAVSDHNRVWLVLGYADGNRADKARALASQLENDFKHTEIQRFRKIRVMLYD